VGPGDLQPDPEIDVVNVAQCPRPDKETGVCTEPELGVQLGQDFSGGVGAIIYSVDSADILETMDCVVCSI
jgi:hypothetical protein